MPQSKPIENSLEEINRIKNYYENLIALSDPDYENSFTRAFQENKSDAFEEGIIPDFDGLNGLNKEENIQHIKTGFWAKINWARVLLTLYLIGILFFTVRLLLLFRWLNQTIKKYGSTTIDGMNLVKLDEEVPPFSFFRFVFINKETASHSGFEQILTHEKVHISQRHSYDLMLAHTITIIQWFNPFAWLINNAMKTNHEYIADRNVVEQGYELFDYQSLLLKQIISIRSVELVNNFNLINIKKRIAMMTKIKSGLSAQLKALVIIPAAILVFFFFSEISFANVETKPKQDINVEDLRGFWKNESADTYGQLLNFKENSLQILESKDSYQQFDFHIPEISSTMAEYDFQSSKISKFVKSKDELTSIHVKAVKKYGGALGDKPFFIAIKNDKLIVAWSKTQVSVYGKVKLTNSLEQYSDRFTDDFELVKNEYYRLADHPERTFYLLMNKNGEMMLQNERLLMEDLPERLDEMRTNDNPFASSTKVAILVIDARCEMQHVTRLFNEMRSAKQLLHLLSVKPFDQKVPEVFYHNVGIPRLLPPLKSNMGPKMITFEEAFELAKNSDLNGLNIDLSAEGYSRETISTRLNEVVSQDSRYVVFLSYDNKTTFKEYIAVLDLVYTTVHAKRNKQALESYNLNFDDLSAAQQKEIRKSYPLALTEKNVDVKE